MGEKKYKYLRKFLYFDNEDPHQRELFAILDKIRYYQSRLVVRLLDDFFKKNHITINTPYDKVQKIIKYYVTDIDLTEQSEQEVHRGPDLNDLSSTLLPLLLALAQQANCNPQTFSSTNNQSPSSLSIMPDEVNVNGSANFASPAKKNDAPFAEEDEMDDDEDDDSILQMAKGFQSMIGE